MESVLKKNEKATMTRICRKRRCCLPESSKAGGTAVLLDALRQQHLLAVAEPLGIVRHPRDRLARAHLHVGVLVQPLVGALHQLPVSTTSTTTVAAWRRGVVVSGVSRINEVNARRAR